MATIYDKIALLNKKGKFYQTKEGASAYKSNSGNKYYWEAGEYYEDFLNKIILKEDN
jgi:hypothetical protein